MLEYSNNLITGDWKSNWRQITHLVCEGEWINMKRAWDKEKFWVPDRNRTHDLPNTGWCWMTLPSMSSRSSVDRAPARCSGGHGFDFCRGLRMFLCPTLVSCWLIHLHISLPSLKFTIINNLSTHLAIYPRGKACRRMLGDHLLVCEAKTNKKKKT